MNAAAFLFLWACFAVASGRVEGMIIEARIRAKDRRKLDKRKLVVFRAVVLALLFLPGFELSWTSALLLAASLPVFALAHRVTINWTRGSKWWYMGPHVRRSGDSWYDGLWHALSADRIREDFDHEGRLVTTFDSSDPRAPFTLCAFFELSFLTFFLFMYLHFTQ